MDAETLHKKFLLSSGVCTDTRQIPENSIFFALRGERFNGNLFVKTALEGGCRWAVADDPSLEGTPGVVIVPSVLGSLQDLARLHRRYVNPTVLAITGSNGKTTTKELLSRVLSEKYSCLFTLGNLNNHIGVPLTLLRLKEEEVAVIEMGANHPGEIATLAAIAEPDLGLITNVGRAHLEGFGSPEGVLKAKGELYDYLAVSGGKALVDGDDELLLKKAEQTGVESLSIGPGCRLSLGLEVLDQSPFLEIGLHIGQESYRLKTSLVGAYNLQNIKLAAAAGIQLGVPGTSIASALESYRPENMRSQLIRGTQNDVIFDSYNANPSSMREAIGALTAYAGGSTMVILGDMAELGASSDVEHLELVKWMDGQGLGRIILVGPIFQRLIEPSEHRLVLGDVEALEAYLDQHAPRDYNILVKGSRTMKLERLKGYLVR